MRWSRSQIFYIKFYQIEDEKEGEIQMEEQETGCVQMIEWEQLKEKERNKQEELLLQSVYKLEPAYWNGVKMVEDYLYGAFCFHEGKNAEKRVISAAFLLKEQDFLVAVLKDKKGTLRQIQADNNEDNNMEENMEVLFDGILKRSQQKIGEMEQYLMEVEQEIVNGRINRNRNQSIFECKRLLSVWKNDYTQFLNMIEEINGLEQKKRETKDFILTEESACYFRIYENKWKRLTEETQFLYEELVHIREALDAALSYEQNRIMKVFTTVTTVFMPLSLIAGWYGMNFAWMPELQWRYGYLFVGVISVLVVLICIWFFKKKKLF